VINVYYNLIKYLLPFILLIPTVIDDDEVVIMTLSLLCDE